MAGCGSDADSVRLTLERSIAIRIDCAALLDRNQGVVIVRAIAAESEWRAILDVVMVDLDVRALGRVAEVRAARVKLRKQPILKVLPFSVQRGGIGVGTFRDLGRVRAGFLVQTMLVEWKDRRSSGSVELGMLVPLRRTTDQLTML